MNFSTLNRCFGGDFGILWVIVIRTRRLSLAVEGYIGFGIWKLFWTLWTVRTLTIVSVYLYRQYSKSYKHSSPLQAVPALWEMRTGVCYSTVSSSYSKMLNHVYRYIFRCHRLKPSFIKKLPPSCGIYKGCIWQDFERSKLRWTAEKGFQKEPRFEEAAFLL